MIYISRRSNLSTQAYIASLGPEPLEKDFTSEYLLKKLSNKKIPIKLATMDNKIVVGGRKYICNRGPLYGKNQPLKTIK